eukprot:TRINITY_DN15996_c0_g1_i1.p1 TRINITY_DN15996_c0_g1~~TRINITY_DN15996_c0_g1_i1.p1  ORF type:complete len:370 (+),score=68.12 TRINITY_DN15996_c0_g1_i1:157-1110(+)
MADLLDNPNPDRPLTIADFGCSTGANSSAAMDIIISEIRRLKKNQFTSSVVVVHEDLPKNNWSEFFNYVYNDPASYLKSHPGVTLLASGQSFYEQVLPPNTLHFGFCHASLHWMSHLPTKLAHHCYISWATPHEWDLCRQQAAKDWKAFLRARASELVAGGVLVVNVWHLEESEFMFDAVFRAGENLREKGILTEEELMDFNIRAFPRTLEEVTEEGVLGEFGFRLVEAYRYPPVRNVYYEAFVKDGDLEGFVEDFGAILSVVNEPTFMTALSLNRTPEEKKNICSQMWTEYKNLLRQQPNKCQNLWGSSFIVLKHI